jgi:hypothetical protein
VTGSGDAIESASRDADQHPKATVRRNLLTPTEGCGAQAMRTSSYGTNARASAASEDAAKQRAGTRAKDSVLSGLSTSPIRFDGAFDIYLLTGGCMIQLNDFRMNRRAAPVRHDQAVELQHHTGIAVNSTRHVNVGDVAVNSDTL